jgi:hypothetical protein
VDLDAVADELYGLTPDDFISTRAAREKQAKGTDNKDLATAIHRLSKPNAVAWLVNHLVRKHPGDIQSLLELGSGMRKATANLSSDLRELSRRQHQVVRGLVQQAEQLAKAAGRPMSADTVRSLEETLYAALADPCAADSIAAGRLTTGLSTTGFAGLQRTGGQPTPTATMPRSGAGERPGPKGRGGEKRVEQAKAKLARATSVAAEAARIRDDAKARVQQADQAVADARELAAQLGRELLKAEGAQSRAESDRGRAQAAFDRADRRAGEAKQRLTDAAAELEHLA